MDVIKVLKDGWNVVVKNPIILVPAFAAALLSSLLSSMSTTATTIPELLSWLTFYIPAIIIVSLVQLFLGGMIIKMAYDSTRRKISMKAAAKFVASKYLTLLLSGIIVGIIVLAGTLAFVIPGIYLAVMLIFYQYAVLIDNKGMTDSMGKSWKTVKGKWWITFAMLLIIGIISFAASFFAGLFSIVSNAVGMAFQFIVNLFILPWYSSSLMFAYLKLRKKK